MADPPPDGRSAWTARLLCLAAGAAAALAHPPWGLLPGLLGYALLLWLLDGSRSGVALRWSPLPRLRRYFPQWGKRDAALSPPPGWSTAEGREGGSSEAQRLASRQPTLRSAFFRGWLAGCAYFLVSLFWIAEPFQVDAANQGWMAPFAVALVAMGMALFWGAAAFLYRALAGRRAARLLVFAGAFALLEWLRGHILTGFPWDLPGETWRAGSPISQAAALVGAYGLTWISLAIAAAPAVIGEAWRGRAAVGAAALTLVALYAFGAWRMAGARAPDPRSPWVRVVQPDVQQSSKYDPALFASIVTRYVSLTAGRAAHPVQIVVWPEGAIPAALGDYLAPGTWTRAAIVGALSPGQTLLMGGYRVADAAAEPPVIYNSLVAVTRVGDGLALAGLYDKFRLVPFGEFLPFDALAGRLGIKTFVHVGDGFSAGPRPRPLRVPGLPVVQPLICYEALYPGFTREGARAAGVRPSWIVNVSNDAWFGATSGPWQHLNMASYRAIEEGLPMVRATPTGVSAVIDAFGRVVPGARLGEGAFGFIDAQLPSALAPTPYSRLGDAPFWLMLIVSLAGARPIWRRR